MKNVILFFLISACVSFASCSSSDDSNIPLPQNNAEKLIGRWIIEEYDLSGTTMTILQDSGETETFVGCGKDLAYDFVFSDNPNTFTSNGSYKLNLNTTSNTGNVTNQLIDFDVASSGSWSINTAGNRITINDGIEEYDISVIELTDTVFRYIRNISTSEVQGTTTINTSATETFILFKLE